MKTKDILELARAKNHMYLDGSSDWKSNYESTVLNMKAVKDATGHAGAVCNWLMEASAVLGMDVWIARDIGNTFQRMALDSKHIQGSALGYKELPWFKVADMRNNVNSSFTAVSICTKICAELGIGYEETQKVKDLLKVAMGEEVAPVVEESDDDEELDF